MHVSSGQQNLIKTFHWDQKYCVNPIPTGTGRNQPIYEYQVTTVNFRKNSEYTHPKNVWGGLFLAGNHGNHQNVDPSLLHKKL